MIEQLIAEATECDFKVAVEKKKPKSWLKSISAFSKAIPHRKVGAILPEVI